MIEQEYIYIFSIIIAIFFSVLFGGYLLVKYLVKPLIPIKVDQSIKNIEEYIHRQDEKLIEIRKQQEKIDSLINEIKLSSSSGINDVKYQTSTLNTLTSKLMDNINKAGESLVFLKSSVKHSDQRGINIYDSIKKIENTISGSKSKGVAGESIIADLLVNIPTSRQIRDFQVNGKNVEFGYILQNNKILPIDSKWPSSDNINKIRNNDNEYEAKRLQKKLETYIKEKTKEIRKYIDPLKTTNFVLAVMPDAVVTQISSILPDISRSKVIVSSYSMLISYLLIIDEFASVNKQDINTSKIINIVNEIGSLSEELQNDLQTKVYRSITTLNNAVETFNSKLVRLQRYSNDIELHDN